MFDQQTQRQTRKKRLLSTSNASSLRVIAGVLQLASLYNHLNPAVTRLGSLALFRKSDNAVTATGHTRASQKDVGHLTHCPSFEVRCHVMMTRSESCPEPGGRWRRKKTGFDSTSQLSFNQQSLSHSPSSLAYLRPSSISVDLDNRSLSLSLSDLSLPLTLPPRAWPLSHGLFQ
jgi:hypothetical protein